MTQFNFEPIAHIESPYKEKFAIPRQPGLVPSAKGKVNLIGEFNQLELVRDIEKYSHLWVVFVFHGTLEKGWKPLVKPPRLGGNAKMGVLATRSTFRPNAIGMSVVKNEGIEVDTVKGKKQIAINISALDLLDGTPVLDIKPYLPYADALPEATSEFAQTPQQHQMKVCFSQEAERFLQSLPQTFSHLRAFICQVLAQDPRPAYKKKDLVNEQDYGMQLYHFNIRWQVYQEHGQSISRVFSIEEK